VKLGAALRADALIARIDDDEIALASPAELLALRRRLTNACHEHRLPLSGGAFDGGVTPRRGSIAARLHLSLGHDRCHFGLETAASWEAVSAYLRACGVAGIDADLLERIEMFEPDSVVQFDGVTLNHIDDDRAWDVRIACATTAELRNAVARTERWADEHDVALEAGSVEFPPVYVRPMATAFEEDFDAAIVHALAEERDENERLLFRVARARMCVGIRQESGRVWLLLEPKNDRVVKSNDDPYALDGKDLARIARAARIGGAVADELRAHVVS
jgi:hypothetical protein